MRKKISLAKHSRGKRPSSRGVRIVRRMQWANLHDCKFGGLSPSRMMVLVRRDQETGKCLAELLEAEFREAKHADKAVLTLRFGVVSDSN